MLCGGMYLLSQSSVAPQNVGGRCGSSGPYFYELSLEKHYRKWGIRIGVWKMVLSLKSVCRSSENCNRLYGEALGHGTVYADRANLSNINILLECSINVSLGEAGRA